jgi:hypothetical protein
MAGRWIFYVWSQDKLPVRHLPLSLPSKQTLIYLSILFVLKDFSFQPSTSSISGGRRAKIQGERAKRPHERHDFLVRQVRRPHETSHSVTTSEI